MQVRLLPPQLYGRASQQVMALRSKRSEGNSLEGSTPSPSAVRALGRAVRHQVPNLDRWVQFPQGTLGDRLTVGRQPLELPVRVRILLPEPDRDGWCHAEQNDSGIG